MSQFKLTTKQLKSYPHFDAPLSLDEANALVSNPHRVAQHAFFPFILYHQKWRRYSHPGDTRALTKVKDRPIRYAARSDAYIFTCYRKILSERYESELKRLGLQEAVVAYRSIRLPSGRGAKSNIHFAKEAFDAIKGYGSCFAICLDIKSFFESLDHTLLKSLWCRILGVSRLPSDHHAVFRAMTRYSVVEKEAVYERLGYFGPKRSKKTGRVAPGYLIPKRRIPTQLCSLADFRAKIVGTAAGPSLIQKHKLSYGIPQGAPLSDLLANLYLIDFDVEVRKIAHKLGGKYLRYSDDILIIVPCGRAEALNVEKEVRTLIGRYGAAMKIEENKSSIFSFEKTLSQVDFERVKGSQGGNGLEYLGFRFDGNSVYLRDSTLSSLYRKISARAKRDAHRHVARYPTKTLLELKQTFDYDGFMQRFGRVKDFSELSGQYQNWTFWTYAKRAVEVFSGDSTKIHRQLRAYRSRVRKKIGDAIEKAAP